ncbi:Protein of unknown function, partial [Cotesia congregata]
MKGEMDEEITWEEFTKTLSGLKNGKSPGEDGLTVEFLKGLPGCWKEELYETINQAWKKEIWGWVKQKKMEQLRGRYAKMIMGLNSNTPDYIWKTEASRTGMELEARRRAYKYIVEVAGMKDDRWPKVCLREEARLTLNKNPTKFGSDMVKALQETEEMTTLLKNMMENKNLEWIETKLSESLRELETKLKTEIRAKVAQSRYWDKYEEITSEENFNSYWEQKQWKGWEKEQWARLRSGNLGRVGNKGYSDTNCRLCGKAEETLDHLWVCDKAKSAIKKEWVKDMENWRNAKEGTELERLTINTLQGEPKTELCRYAREFEKL